MTTHTQEASYLFILGRRMPKSLAAALFLSLTNLLFANDYHVFVNNNNSHNVSVIDTTSNTVIATVIIGNSPEDLVITPDNSKVYVTNFSDGTVSVISTTSNTVIATVAAGAPHPTFLAVTPDSSQVYVVTESSFVS